MLSHLAIQGRRALGLSVKLEAIAWALEQVNQGVEGQHLYLLAGMNETDYEVDILEAFDLVLKKLGLEVLQDQAAIKAYARWVCQEILTSQISLREGHQQLYAMWKSMNYTYHNAAIFDRWMYLDDLLELKGG